MRDVLELGFRQVITQFRILKTLARLVGGHGDQVVQFQHAAGAGLEGLAVGAVHGAEAKVLQRLFRRVTGQIRDAEHLLEMLGLTLVHDIQDQVRRNRLLAVQNGGKVRRAIHGRTFRRDNQQRRRRRHLNDRTVIKLLFAGFALARDVDDLRARILDQKGFDL